MVDDLCELAKKMTILMKHIFKWCLNRIKHILITLTSANSEEECVQQILQHVNSEFVDNKLLETYRANPLSDDLLGALMLS